MNEKLDQEKDTDKQHKKQYDWLKQYQWQKGQSGNPGGVKKGKRLKTFAAEIIESMDDESKAKFLREIEPRIVWEMAEGKAKQETEHSGNLTISQVLDELENGHKTEEQRVEIEQPLQDKEQKG